MAQHLQSGQFYGSVQDRRRSGGAVLSELFHASGRKLPRHAHEHPYFCLLLTGAYHEQWAHTDIPYQPFTTVFHPGDFCHVDEIGARGARFFAVEVPQNEWVSSGIMMSTEVHTDTTNGALARSAVRLFIASRLGDSLELPVAELCQTVIRKADEGPAERRRPKWLDRVTEHMEHAADQPLSLAALAQTANVHPVHLSRTFERYEHCAISERVRLLRAQRAMRAIAQGTSNLADVACEAGFTDQSHLTRVFRHVLGVTPGQFRSALERKSNL